METFGNIVIGNAWKDTVALVSIESIDYFKGEFHFYHFFFNKN